jgi:predicted lipoprotein with Yx(FWY)xxD motif
MGFRQTTLALATLGMAMLAGPALATSHGNALVHARELGGSVFMMNQYHMTLYTFDLDDPGVSRCYDACAQTWPPATLPAGAELGENYTLIKRTDGTMQIAYKGKPLYLYSGDKRIGDTKGDGKGGVWRVSRPLD